MRAELVVQLPGMPKKERRPNMGTSNEERPTGRATTRSGLQERSKIFRPSHTYFLLNLLFSLVARLKVTKWQRSFFFFARVSCSEQSAFHGRAADPVWFFSDLLFQSVAAKKRKKRGFYFPCPSSLSWMYVLISIRVPIQFERSLENIVRTQSCNYLFNSYRRAHA